MKSFEKIQAIGEVLRTKGVSALIVQTQDAHNSEYVAKKDSRREWVSDFTGSAGTAVIVVDDHTDIGARGVLFVDSRYHIQADAQVDLKHWTVMKMGLEGVPGLVDFLSKTLKNKKDAKVGIDPRFINANHFEIYSDKLGDIELVPALGFLDTVRDKDVNFELTGNEMIFPHDLKFSGESTEDKIGRIREQVSMELGVKDNYALIVTDLSNVCWVMNMRGRNFINCCPVFFGYCIITDKDVQFFCDITTKAKDAEALKTLEEYLNGLKKTVNLKIYGYKEFDANLKNLVKENYKAIVSAGVSQHIIEICSNTEVLRDEKGIISLFKALKNDVEIQRMRETSIEDSVAMVRYLHWLDQTITDKNIKNKKVFNEVQVSDQLEKFRSEGKDFAGLSFDTISSYGSNGAIIHYKAEKDNELLKELGTDSLYLCDSGGQYSSGGTTDVTRTVCFGTPTDEMKKFFTLVLNGHAALASADFTEKTNGAELDELARKSLKENKANYGHGTSHGVGAYLNVHEMPPYLHKSQTLQHGMCLSNEPGYYKQGDFGIRIENVVVTLKNEATGRLGFETLNYIPMQLKMIHHDYITKEAKDWLNNYHEQCSKILTPLLTERKLKKELKWLEAATQKI